ncbi:UNVERIFIED_CONTAM: hypothetical protein HDU68_010576 [Siphonaria sp. JEL0065]|nr:hypothetical protein HDU68_010576 [Siphonaria sp. JEL0065]
MTTDIPSTRRKQQQTSSPSNAHTSTASTASTAPVAAVALATKLDEAATKAVQVLETRWANHNKTLISSFAFGSLLAIDGVIRSLRSSITRTHLLNVFTTLAITILIVYILAQFATLPVRILRRIVWGITWASTLDSSHHNSSFLQYFDLAVSYLYKGFFALVLSVPELGLYIVRYYFPGPMDKIFKESLSTFMSEIENPQFRLVAKNASKAIDASLDPKEGSKVWYSNLQAFVARYASRLKILFFVWLLSFVPVIGFLAWPSATFLYIGDKINYPTAGCLFVLTFVSPRLSKYIRGPLLRAVLELRALARELVDPYLSRSKMTREMKEGWLNRNDAVIIGFTVPFFVLLWVPLVGPALYFALANSCAARLCMELFETVDFDEGGNGQKRELFEPRLGFTKKEVSGQVMVLAGSGDVLLEASMDLGFKFCGHVLAEVRKQVASFLSSGLKKNE